jgi:hypothetical protein
MLKMKINPGSSVGERRRGQLIYISLKKKKKKKEEEEEERKHTLVVDLVLSSAMNVLNRQKSWENPKTLLASPTFSFFLSFFLSFLSLPPLHPLGLATAPTCKLVGFVVCSLVRIYVK